MLVEREGRYSHCHLGSERGARHRYKVSWKRDSSKGKFRAPQGMASWGRANSRLLQQQRAPLPPLSQPGTASGQHRHSASQLLSYFSREKTIHKWEGWAVFWVNLASRRGKKGAVAGGEAALLLWVTPSSFIICGSVQGSQGDQLLIQTPRFII